MILDRDALDWGIRSHQEHPVGDDKEWVSEANRFETDQKGKVVDGIQWVNGDARKLW